MFITALDLGSSQIKILVGEIERDNKLSLLGVLKSGSAGMRRGELVSPDDISGQLGRMLNDVKQIHKTALKNIFINVNGANVRIHNSRGIVAVSRADNEIYQDDVDRVLKASQAINLGANRMILHTLTREFIVDGSAGIMDPLGMVGNRLEVHSLIVDAFKSSVNNVIKSVELAGGEIAGLIYSPLAASRSVLNKTQKDLGVVMVDIGNSTTGISIYEEDNLLQASVLPMGAGNITNDLAIGLKCSVKAAEAIKLSFGFALAKEISNKEKVKLIGKLGKLPAGVVLAGGGAKTPGIVELAKQELKLSVQIGIPEISNLESVNADFGAELEDPEFAVSAGLLVCGNEESVKDRGWLIAKKSNWPSKILKYFLP
ncbi:cell division protein FtsA [Candidatus Wolfebacteria bacterium]|nr:cell division protein FtsA [Candidatus Wolfebacteria bacterium]